MKRLKCLKDVQENKNTIPAIAYIRGVQFCGSQGFSADRDGYLIALDPNDDISQIKEIGEDGLFTDGTPNFEYVETYLDGDSVCVEIVLAVDADRTIAIFVKQDCLDPVLFSLLQRYSPPIGPIPQEVLP